MKLKEKEIDELLTLEWIETNGLGGYASSSITGANTRKYHGLLVASYNPPTDRKVIVGKIEERVFINNTYCDLSVNQYTKTIHPKGHLYLQNFSRKPMLTWSYGQEDWKLRKQLFMAQGSNTTVISYQNTGKKAYLLELHPLWEFKDYHNNYKEHHPPLSYEQLDGYIKVNLPNQNHAYWDWSEGEFVPANAWYKDFKLRKETYRGEPDTEDLYRLGYVKLILAPGEKIKISFSTDAEMVGKNIENLEINHQRFIKKQKSKLSKHTFYNDLLWSGNQFIVKRATTQSKTIIAGYHWFTDWGRDTMIAMRGLTIAIGDQKTSKSLLSTFLKYTSKGMLPNRFPDFSNQEVEYNTIDATLWLFVSLYEYHQKFNDLDFVKKNLKTLEKILVQHLKGTRYNIHVTPEGFLYGGEDGVQLTWMDALVNGHVVTPRMGCPVEINALWYNALCIYQEFAKACKVKVKREIVHTTNKFTTNFKTYFLNNKGYLNDVYDRENGIDDCFRSNQIYVVSLPFSLLTQKEEKEIVKKVEEKLLTPYGLRTLAPDDPDFKGIYGGNQWHRDLAYHQGTVWTFILMDYFEAYLKTKKYSTAAKKKVVKALQPLKEHFYQQDGLYCISEIFDGNNPLAGRGCIHQAWSVAALVKLYSDHQLYEIS
ncbi:amylo-alpha-1,6-glucosidase [Ochrovirga pacifica]|uniref:amylo-alpha-1,6-glucosidase n=1 Tax=Ochrovirga pacifica TaxID=1042376 RepID=UPI0002558395|nr:amylo-alpha-1,6-glucosidase [Ochrovirga pacifica]